MDGSDPVPELNTSKPGCRLFLHRGLQLVDVVACQSHRSRVFAKLLKDPQVPPFLAAVQVWTTHHHPGLSTERMGKPSTWQLVLVVLVVLVRTHE